MTITEIEQYNGVIRPGDATPEQIAERCAEVQARWSPRQRIDRRMDDGWRRLFENTRKLE
jgi:hypothetical protein